MNFRFFRTIVVPFSLVLLCTILLSLSLADQGKGYSLVAYAQSQALKSKYGAKKDEINNQISAISGELNSLNSNFETISNQKKTLKEQVAAIEAEIAQVNQLITETKLAISKLEEQINQNQAEIDQVRQQLKEIIHTIQKQSQTSKLEVLLTSKNLSEAMSSMYNLNNVQSRATQLSTRMEKLSVELNDNKNKQEEVQKTLQDSQYLLASKQDGLKILLQKTEGEEPKYQELIRVSEEQRKTAEANLGNVEAEYQNAIVEEERQLAEARRREQEAAAKAGGNITGGYTDKGNGGSCSYTEYGDLGAGNGVFVSPTEGWVSQDYWCGGYGGHDGWDIANGMGTPIVAVYNGVVERTGYHPSGFGHFVLIKHDLPSGKRVYTMYAHMQSPSSASGAVSQGQVIGNMGTSGLSTGPHLHFMFISDSYDSTKNVGCRYGNSKCYDPADYL
jgi:murein DD-endopeptidase MepM/ murein hydrolase activator NlpD